MAGDYTRATFKPRRDHAGVLMQQGRVTLDADWNEAPRRADRPPSARGDDRHHRSLHRAGGDAPDSFRFGLSGGTLTIGRGRAYVHGILAECHGADPGLRPSARRGARHESARLREAALLPESHSAAYERHTCRVSPCLAAESDGPREPRPHREGDRRRHGDTAADGVAGLRLLKVWARYDLRLRALGVGRADCPVRRPTDDECRRCPRGRRSMHRPSDR